MASDPKYVRLTRRMNKRMLADIRSGFKVSGNDVVEFPTLRNCPDQATYRARRKFARSRIASGVLEPASQAEFDEVSATKTLTANVVKAVRDAVEKAGAGHPERLIQEEVRKVRRDVDDRAAEREAAEEADDSEPDDEDDGDPDFDFMSKEALFEWAEEEGFEVKKSWSKAKLLEEIETQREEAEAEE